MKTNHTPSPWNIDELEGPIDGEDFITIEHDGMPLCEVRGTNDMSCLEDDEMMEVNEMVIANARLIAAAPDLLEALETLRAAFVVAVGDKSPFAKVALTKVDEAISKAKGL